MSIKTLLVVLASIDLAACGSSHPRPVDFNFWAKDRTFGVFFSNDNLAIGSVEYVNGKVSDKGMESKSKMVRAETDTATCLSAGRFVMALPKEAAITSGVARCGSVAFVVTPANGRDACNGALVTLKSSAQGGGSPRWYCYDQSRGVVSMSFDPRGLSLNTMTLDGIDGPMATRN